MKKRSISTVSAILAMILSVGILSSCKKEPAGSQNSTDGTLAPSVTESEDKSESEEKSEVEEKTESKTEHISEERSETDDSGKDTEKETSSDTDSKTEETVITPEGDLGEQIAHANKLANGVNAYYGSSLHDSYVIENQNMSLKYSLTSSKDKLVNYLANHSGGIYLADTMDVFVRMNDGNTYLASSSNTVARANLYRMGYYYYEARLEGQDFIDELTVTSESNIDLIVAGNNSFSKAQVKGGELIGVIGSTYDPYISFGGISVPIENATHIRMTIKVDPTVSSSAGMYLLAGSYQGFNANQLLRFDIINDGEYHTYDISLHDVDDCTGDLRAFRLDFEGSVGSKIFIKDVKAITTSGNGAPEALSINRSFLVYSDKMHQKVQFAATSAIENIAEVGIVTRIPKDSVSKLTVADKKGEHTSISDVDWASAEYVGFDIKDAGIFGIILPFDGKGGSLCVTEENGYYVIEQTAVPQGNKIIPSLPGSDNGNDFYMGSRVYTDENHDFEAFLHAVKCEREPYTAKNFSIDAERSDSASFLGYDSLRGIYIFKISGSDFNTSYYNTQNKHYALSLRVKGHDDRSIYIMTTAATGALECAALLDCNGMLLPMPIEVAKNFCEGQGGEMNLFNLDDKVYSEAIIPICVKKGDHKTYTLLNLYQNWGKYPLKQISSIQFYAPYYHLSTGVSESNCIVPYGINTLPDFRSMSSPLWSNQPQHSSCGTHTWLEYTDADGNFSRSDNTANTVGSFGPTYADVTMEHISTDGRIKVTYNHLEMPQTDENRTYYTISYDILDDISITDFKKNFTFYSVSSNDPSGYYAKVGYLNENNETVVTDAAESGTKFYKLGSKCPYFSFFDMRNWSSTSQQGYANLALLVYNSSFVIGGEKADPAFALKNTAGSLALSLDLDDVTLKAGDRFELNIILLPWGSQNSDYSGEAPDKNVRDVRANTLLSPLTATAIADSEVIKSVYLPKIKTTNGKSAEFTLSGGENNVSVRVYGFEKLTSPVIEELIDGKWMPYEICSISTPDSFGNAHYYDGYSVYYDGDGTYSYSFVTTMVNGAERTFRITAAEDFKNWPEEPKAESPDLLDVYLDPTELGAMIGTNAMFGGAELSDDGSFVKVYGNGASQEAFINVRRSDDGSTTGQYIVLKYRIPKEFEGRFGLIEFFASTENLDVVAGESIRLSHVSTNGEWAVLIIDASARGISTFVSEADGTYSAKALRYDIFNATVDASTYIEIAYVGMSSSLEDVYALNSDMSQVFLLKNGGTPVAIDPLSGNEIGKVDEPPVYIDPTSGYSESDLMYTAWIDMVNGIGPGGTTAYVGLGGNSVKGIDTVKLNASTIDGYHLVLSGWTVVEGGVEKYLWSADGGKTWNDVTLHKLESIVDGNDVYLDTAISVSGITYEYSDREASKANVGYQGGTGMGDEVPGVSADLAAFAGNSVNVTFAAVPKSAPQTLCLILHVTGVEVPVE